MDPNNRNSSRSSGPSDTDKPITPREQYTDDSVEGASEGSSRLSRRDLLKKGWSVPVVAAMAMPSTAKAWGKHRSPGKKKGWEDKNDKKEKWNDKHGDKGERGRGRGRGIDVGGLLSGLFG